MSDPIFISKTVTKNISAIQSHTTKLFIQAKANDRGPWCPGARVLFSASTKSHHKVDVLRGVTPGNYL